MQEDIIFDCSNLRNISLTAEDFDFPPTSPTLNHDNFVRNFRTTAKHPFRMSANVSELPRVEELSTTRLPYIGGHEPGSESDSDLAHDQKRFKNKKLRGRGIKENPKLNLKAFFAVSMTRKEKSILLLYSRQNVYLVAIRDAQKQWWEFSTNGGKLFKKTNGLGFSESYTDMGVGTHVSISLFQFQEAFFVFSEPSKYSVEQRKRASRVMIALSAESGRMTTLSNKFGATLCDESGQLKEILSGSTELLITNWRKVSHKIIDNSGSSNLNNNMSNILDESDAELVQVLREAGMEKVEDAPNVYGLLLAKPTFTNTIS